MLSPSAEATWSAKIAGSAADRATCPSVPPALVASLLHPFAQRRGQQMGLFGVAILLGR